MRRLGAFLIVSSFVLAGLGLAVPSGAQQSTYQRFFVHCAQSHAAHDDPIVFGSQPGASHLHEFFGNPATNHDPSYDRMMASNATSCDLSTDTAAYWVPALRNKTTGEVVHATTIRAYYAASFNGPQQNTIHPFPRGFSIITDDFDWFCGNNQRLPSPPDCTGTGKTLGLMMHFVQVCWNGSIPGRNAGANWDAKVHTLPSEGVCHEGEKQLPKLRYEVRFPVVDGTDWEVVSEPGRGPHADFWNTWRQGALIDLVAECLQPPSPDCKVVED